MDSKITVIIQTHGVTYYKMATNSNLHNQPETLILKAREIVLKVINP